MATIPPGVISRTAELGERAADVGRQLGELLDDVELGRVLGDRRIEAFRRERGAPGPERLALLRQHQENVIARSRSASAGRDVVVEREDHRGGPVAQAQLGEYVVDMGLHGALSDEQLLRDSGRWWWCCPAAGPRPGPGAGGPGLSWPSGLGGPGEVAASQIRVAGPGSLIPAPATGFPRSAVTASTG